MVSCAVPCAGERTVFLICSRFVSVGVDAHGDPEPRLFLSPAYPSCRPPHPSCETRPFPPREVSLGIHKALSFSKERAL